MSLDDAMAQALDELPQGLAVGYVDMRSGTLLAVDSELQYPSELFRELSLHVGNLLQGSHITHAEDVVDAARGTNRPAGTHYFNDMILFTDHTLHIFLRGKLDPETALVFVCRENTNVGMAFYQARRARDAIEAQADPGALAGDARVTPATIPAEDMFDVHAAVRDSARLAQYKSTTLRDKFRRRLAKKSHNEELA